MPRALLTPVTPGRAIPASGRVLTYTAVDTVNKNYFDNSAGKAVLFVRVASGAPVLTIKVAPGYGDGGVTPADLTFTLGVGDYCIGPLPPNVYNQTVAEDTTGAANWVIVEASLACTIAIIRLGC